MVEKIFWAEEKILGGGEGGGRAFILKLLKKTSSTNVLYVLYLYNKKCSSET